MKREEFRAIVIGSGAAGYSAACRIREAGVESVCIVTEGVYCGTSRNAGSDKQTYYKLGLGGSIPDSVRDLAADLFAGGCVDGDVALCEAALSARCFYYLCEMGVPFPGSLYGEYTGYRTDHDRRARATSAGPLTSKMMTEALERRAAALGIRVYDHLLAVELLVGRDGVYGLLCLDRKGLDYRVFRCGNVVMATGGPGEVYADSVFPPGQGGATGLAVRAGAALQNLTEWQYGLASVSPRWNVSGTYMQVLPRFISKGADGESHEFLEEYFADRYQALSLVFRKGYQWPFDAAKAREGSSLLDVLVYRESVIKKRRVFLDFTRNPFGLQEIPFHRLCGEAYEYLKTAGACFGTPIERLEAMNAPAAAFYRSRGVDLAEDCLEIALCAQHHNGGIAVDHRWSTTVKGLFAVGECAGTHGVARPGGSALNAGQAGALRAARFIAASCDAPVNESRDEEEFRQIACRALEEHRSICARALENAHPAAGQGGKLRAVPDALRQARERMGAYAGAFRDADGLKSVYSQVKAELEAFGELYYVEQKEQVPMLYRLRDVLTVQLVTLAAMIDYAGKWNVSRGSALYYDAGGTLAQGLEEQFRFSVLGAGETKREIQQVTWKEGNSSILWRPVRPIPEEEECFERMWSRSRRDTCEEA